MRFDGSILGRQHVGAETRDRLRRNSASAKMRSPPDIVSRKELGVAHPTESKGAAGYALPPEHSLSFDRFRVLPRQRLLPEGEKPVRIGGRTFADLIGLDVLLSVVRTLHQDFGDPKYRPAPALGELVDAGCWGRKSGRGVYRY